MIDRDKTKKYLQYMISHCESLLKFSDMMKKCYPILGKNMDIKLNNDLKNQIKLMSSYCSILLENLYDFNFDDKLIEFVKIMDVYYKDDEKDEENDEEDDEEDENEDVNDDEYNSENEEENINLNIKENLEKLEYQALRY